MLQNLGYTAILLGVLVFVHELGHFLVAKACGVKVLRFSIGFGPRIIGFTRGETEYRISWLPLGGYVKMAGEQPHEELNPEEAGRGFLAQAPWKRGLIVAAGPAFNLIFPVLVYFFVFVGPHQATSNRVGSVEPGLPAAEAGIKPGDRIVAVDGEKVETFLELRQALQPRYDKQVSLTVDRDGKQFVAQLNPVRAVDVNPVETVPRGMIGIGPISLPPVVGVPAGSPAEAAGLRTFDRILSVNGTPVKDEVTLNKVLADASGTLELKVARFDPVTLPGVTAQVPSVHALRLEKQPGEAYAALGAERVDLYVHQVDPGSPAEKAGIRPGDELLELNGKPIKSSTLFFNVGLVELEAKPFTLTWRSGTEVRTAELRQAQIEEKDEIGNALPSYSLGIRARRFTDSETGSPETVTRHMGVGDALSSSLKVVPEAIRGTAILLGKLFIGQLPFKSVGGPVMLYQIASKSAEGGLDMFLNSMAMISINLGLMNLLPIPVLDGFHLLAAIWEGIRRRPISIRAREIANLVGLAMLLLLMVLAMRNDLLRIFS